MYALNSTTAMDSTDAQNCLLVFLGYFTHFFIAKLMQILTHFQTAVNIPVTAKGIYSSPLLKETCLANATTSLRPPTKENQKISTC